MIVIIAGGRDFADYELLLATVQQSGFAISEIVSGCARGADTLGERYATDNGIKIRRMRPDWSLGRVAGILRNKDMARVADGLIAFWDGKSRGTKNMIEEAEKRGLCVHVCRY
jgi:hypothetical protein